MLKIFSRFSSPRIHGNRHHRVIGRHLIDRRTDKITGHLSAPKVHQYRLILAGVAISSISPANVVAGAAANYPAEYLCRPDVHHAGHDNDNEQQNASFNPAQYALR